MEPKPIATGRRSQSSNMRGTRLGLKLCHSCSYGPLEPTAWSEWPHRALHAGRVLSEAEVSATRIHARFQRSAGCEARKQ
eukprot:2957-Eustigmatos_ZCMA.PRE.1